MNGEIECIRRACRGDKNAFGELVESYQHGVYNLTYRMLGNAYEAEEAAQETFVRAYTRLRTYDQERPFRTWLLSIASHHCVDRLRRRRGIWLSLDGDDENSPLEYLSSDEPGPEAVLSQREIEQRVQGLLDRLSPQDRAAVTLLYWNGCSYEEIASILGLSISALKSRLHRARRAMGLWLQQEAQEAEETSNGRTSG